MNYIANQGNITPNSQTSLQDHVMNVLINVSLK